MSLNKCLYLSKSFIGFLRATKSAAALSSVCGVCLKSNKSVSSSNKAKASSLNISSIELISFTSKSRMLFVSTSFNCSLFSGFSLIPFNLVYNWYSEILLGLACGSLLYFSTKSFTSLNEFNNLSSVVFAPEDFGLTFRISNSSLLKISSSIEFLSIC